MRNRHDQTSKRIIRRAIEPGGAFTSEMEVSPDAQRFDGHFVPHAAHAAARRHSDLLDRMSARVCTFEAFHVTPDPGELSECVRKLLNARHVLGQARPPPQLPYLWVLSSGRPVSAIAGFGARRKRGWPRGVYEPPPCLFTGIVVVSELPETRATLLLRLMGAGRTLRRALAELGGLPADTRERRIARPILIECRIEIENSPARTPEDEEFLMETQDIAEKFLEEIRQEGRQEGRQQGRHEGRQQALIDVYRARFNAMPRELQTIVKRTEDDGVLRGWIPIFATGSAAEIAVALRGR